MRDPTEDDAENSMGEDIDDDVEESEDDMYDDESDPDEVDQAKAKQAPINFIMDKESHIYYVNKFDGQLIFREINPMYDEKKDHITIYEIKTDDILGLGISEDSQTFYFMDNFKIINKLQRMKDSKTLIEVDELLFKDKDRPNF